MIPLSKQIKKIKNNIEEKISCQGNHWTNQFDVVFKTGAHSGLVLINHTHLYMIWKNGSGFVWNKIFGDENKFNIKESADHSMLSFSSVTNDNFSILVIYD